jgi:hypothetical protein
MAKRGHKEWVPPAVGLVPEDFYGRAVDITEVMTRFRLKYKGRVVSWGVKNDKIPADVWVDYFASDLNDAIRFSVKIIMWLGRNGMDVITDGPPQLVGSNTWRFKCQVVVV